jgi:hypothetical protein
MCRLRIEHKFTGKIAWFWEGGQLQILSSVMYGGLGSNLHWDSRKIRKNLKWFPSFSLAINRARYEEE